MIGGDRLGIIQVAIPLSRRSSSVRPLRPCPCGCGRIGLCDQHRARLHRVRDELADSRRAKSKGNGLRRVALPPKCCNPECVKARVPPAAFCEACVAAGWVEEAA